MMTEQEIWNDDVVLRIHNFDKLDATVTYGIQEDVQPFETPFKNVVELPPEPMPIVEPPKPQPVVMPPPPPPVPEVTDRPRSKYRTAERETFFCLPAVMVEKTDKLYGDKIMRVAYQDPFKFQGAVIEQSDFQCLMWTTVKQITVNSIIYSSDARRWWKVTEIHSDERNDGFVLVSVVSDLQPDFTSLG